MRAYISFTKKNDLARKVIISKLSVQNFLQVSNQPDDSTPFVIMTEV